MMVTTPSHPFAVFSARLAVLLAVESSGQSIVHQLPLGIGQLVPGGALTPPGTPIRMTGVGYVVPAAGNEAEQIAYGRSRATLFCTSVIAAAERLASTLSPMPPRRPNRLL